MHFELTEEHLMIQQAAREFAQNELKPGVIERDEPRWPFVGSGDARGQRDCRDGVHSA